MSLRNKINLYYYLIGTILNFCVFQFFVDKKWVLMIVTLGVLVNQWLLMIYGSKLLGLNHDENSLSTLAGVLKIFVIITVFYIAMSHELENIAYIIGSYIFQLIIFALSIKKDVKK